MKFEISMKVAIVILLVMGTALALAGFYLIHQGIDAGKGSNFLVGLMAVIMAGLFFYRVIQSCWP